MKEEFETRQKSIKSSYFCGSKTIDYVQFRAVLSIMFNTSSREGSKRGGGRDNV